jgi:hypothetical protein
MNIKDNEIWEAATYAFGKFMNYSFSEGTLDFL